jgi:hypothetical protein
MSRFQRPQVLRTDGVGKATLHSGGAIHADGTYKLVLTDLRVRVTTPAIDVTEEDFASAGGRSDTSPRGSGVAANVTGDTTHDVMNFASLGYPRGTVTMRGNIPLGEALGLTATNFDTVDSDGYESASKIFEVVVRLGHVGAALAGAANGDQYHWMRFKMFLETCNIDWSVRAANVDVTLEGKLSGLLSSYGGNYDLPNITLNQGSAAS